MPMPDPLAAPGPEAWPEDAVEVGRIGEAWGLQGAFRVLPHAATPEALFASKRWHLQADPQRRRPPGSAPLPTLLRILRAREHGEGVVATARDIDSREAAEALRGARIFVARSSFPTAGEGEYYWVDLIGLAVVNREGQHLGRVQDLLDTGAHSVLRVVGRPPEPAATPDPEATAASRPGRQAAGPGMPPERLIPFVAAYIDEVDREAGCIRVDWGLDY